MKTAVLSALIALMATGAVAHSKVNTTTPPDMAQLTEAPSEITLTFTDEIRLTRVSLTRDANPATDLDLGNQTSFAIDFVLPLPVSGSGSYTVQWRGLGTDGHAMQGAFTFQVD